MARLEVFTARVNLGEAVVGPRLGEIEEKLPKGWTSERRRSSVTFRPKNKMLPCVKLYYTPLLIDYDYKEGRTIRSMRLLCTSVEDALSKVQARFATFA